MEIVEVCPYCCYENIYQELNFDTQEFIVICQQCGKKIFLCDKCFHSEDNSGMNCDWHLEGSCSVCMRGRIEEETK